MNKVPGWVSRYVGNKTFDFSSKKRIFCPKTTKFGPKLAFLVDMGQAMQVFWCPVGGSVGDCGARAVSRKTPIYFIVIILCAQVEMMLEAVAGVYFLHPMASSPQHRQVVNPFC